MGWWSNTVERVRELTAGEAIDCPRGWGKVAFAINFHTFWPWISVERTCPISGADCCADCDYEPNPDAFRLGEQFAELNRLRAEGQLSSEEYDDRRRALVELFRGSSRRDGFLVAACVLGPLGLVFACAGVITATRIHPGFWGLAGAGAVLLALAIGFAGIHRARKEESEA